MLIRTADYKVTDASFKLAQEWHEANPKHHRVALTRAIRMYKKEGMTARLEVLLSAINLLDRYIINPDEGWWEFDPSAYTDFEGGIRQHI